MRRVAIVVQRCHESVVGGSEALAWQYARLLSPHFAVEVLSSTATDCVSWADVLPAGPALRDGIALRRFPVVFERGAYWYELHRRLMQQVQPHLSAGPCLWREAQQEEYIRFQGPYCPDLDAWLRQHRDDYAAVLFCTYLYSTTYSGIRHIAPARSILVPTLHDEPPAWLPVYAQRYAQHPQRIWLTRAEQRTSRRLWGFDGGEVLGMAVEDAAPATAERRARPYFLYCGRIEAGKGCDELLRAHERLRGRASLVLTGDDQMGLPSTPDIEYLGFVDAARKRALMAGALAFILPSRYESFSIVTLEAMAQGTPVLVNGRCDVMREHIERSGGGYFYMDFEQMIERMERLCRLDAGERERLGAAGRDYVADRYATAHVGQRLVTFVDAVIAAADGLAGSQA